MLWILMTLAWSNIPVVAQDNQVILRFSPPVLVLRPGTHVTVNVVVENVQALYGLEFHVLFDPDILEVVDADPDEAGIQIKPADWWNDGFVAVNKVDNGSGRIDYAATLLRPAQAVNGRLAVATITLAAKKSGTSMLHFESAILSTRNAKAIPYTKQAGKVAVSPSGQTPEEQASAGSAGPAPGRLALAGAGMLAFLAALGVFIYVVRRRR